MIRRYNTVSLLWGVPGLILQIGGNCLHVACTDRMRQAHASRLLESLALAGIALGTVFLLIGLAYYAKAKGRSHWWCLSAFASLLGLIVLACLEDRTWCSKVIKRDSVGDT
jgi:hypothetical protein